MTKLMVPSNAPKVQETYQIPYNKLLKLFSQKKKGRSTHPLDVTDFTRYLSIRDDPTVHRQFHFFKTTVLVKNDQGHFSQK